LCGNDSRAPDSATEINGAERALRHVLNPRLYLSGIDAFLDTIWLFAPVPARRRETTALARSIVLASPRLPARLVGCRSSVEHTMALLQSPERPQ
jgi:hypothetical protein